jgi:hypothetical protein
MAKGETHRILTGFNTTAEVDGIAYHVQTEDRRSRNPRVQTLVYCSGNILSSWQSPYGEVLDCDELDEIVLELMRRQHETVLREVQAGRFQEKYFKRILQDYLTNKTLEEVILAYKASTQKAT